MYPAATKVRIARRLLTPRIAIRAAPAPRVPACRPRPSRIFAKKDGEAASAKEKSAKQPADAASSSGADSTEGEGSTTEGDNEELDLIEKLRLAIIAGDLEDATVLVDAAVDEVSALASIVEAAEAQAKATQVTLDQLKDQYRRLQADFDNFRNRANKEKEQAGANGKRSVIEDLLPTIDGFELACKEVVPKTAEEEKVSNSYQALYRQMVELLRRNGLEAVPTEGHPFDPEIHDGIMREENTETENNTVLQEFRKGFKFKDKLLRPAMVKVSYRDDVPSSPASESESASSATESS